MEIFHIRLVFKNSQITISSSTTPLLEFKLSPVDKTYLKIVRFGILKSFVLSLLGLNVGSRVLSLEFNETCGAGEFEFNCNITFDNYNL